MDRWTPKALWVGSAWAAVSLLGWVPGRLTLGCLKRGGAMAKKPRGLGAPIGSLCSSSAYTCGAVVASQLDDTEGRGVVLGDHPPTHAIVLPAGGSGQVAPGLTHRSPPC